MSRRQFRRLTGGNVLPPPDDSSDDDFQPLYANKPSKSMYAMLELSSNSEPEAKQESPDETEIVNVTKKVKKNKKKQSRFKNNYENQKEEDFEKVLSEINQAFAAVDMEQPKIVESPVRDKIEEVLHIEYRYLNVDNEFKRLFGSDDGLRRRRNPNRVTIKKPVIVSMPNNPQEQFHGHGLSMSILKREGQNTSFIFNHRPSYQRRHRGFLKMSSYYKNNDWMFPMQEFRNEMYVEGLLEVLDSYFKMEEYTTANHLLQFIIAYYQYIAHPSFNMTGDITLEYKIVENRPFHVAILKFLHLSSNKACHRTALELAKLLLKLDRSDPLAMVFMMDVFAIRAREHDWLINTIDYWTENNMELMFNMKYSYALANFHVAVKKKADLSHADELLQMAMISFPTFVTRVLELFQTSEVAVCKHELFADAETSTSQSLADLIYLHAKFISPRWREQSVTRWLVRNAKAITVKYDEDHKIKELVAKLKNVRLNVYRAWPEEIKRHLTVIKPMAQLLIDEDIPNIEVGLSSNPVPPKESLDRYKYEMESETRNVPEGSPLHDFFSTLLLQYDPTEERHPGMLQINREMMHLVDELLEEDIVNGIDFEPIDEEGAGPANN